MHLVGDMREHKTFFTESISCKISKEHFHDYDTRC
jgi:hypothetical protein